MRISDWSSDVCSSDLLFEESWIQCDCCKRWVHQICAMFNHKLMVPDQQYCCPVCLWKVRADRSLPETLPAPKQAKTLPETHLSKFIERRRSEEHTSELQSLMSISYAVFCLKKKK